MTDRYLPSTNDEPTRANNGMEGHENRHYDLNKDISLAKKLQFTERVEIYVEETGGGVKVLLNIGTYEVFRTAIHEYFCGEGEGSTLSTFPWLTIMAT